MNNDGVVKVLLPPLPPGSSPYPIPAVIHDEQRKHVERRQLTEYEKAMMGTKPLAYFRARWSDTSGWVLTAKVRARGF